MNKNKKYIQKNKKNLKNYLSKSVDEKYLTENGNRYKILSYWR